MRIYNLFYDYSTKYFLLTTNLDLLKDKIEELLDTYDKFYIDIWDENKHLNQIIINKYNYLDIIQDLRIEEKKLIDSIQTECLQEFIKTYRESTSGDLQTFILGMTKFCEKYFNK